MRALVFYEELSSTPISYVAPIMVHWITALPWFHYLDLTQKEVYYDARFEKDSRYYVIRLSQDLLEDWVLTLINGRIKSKLGQSRTLAFTSFNEAFDHFCALAKLRHQRRYQLKTITFDNHLMMHLLPFLVHIEDKKELPAVKTIKNIKSASILSRTSPQTPSQQLGFVF